LVSTDVASIPDSLRKINIFWLEASTSTKRAPSTWNSFYRNLNDRLLDVMWQKKLIKEMVYFFFFFFFLISKRNFIKSAFNEISLDQVKTQISNKKDVTRDEIR
jgi:hypothetical protein